MREPTYIAELTEGDYPRFREKDPELPETYGAWLKATVERVDIMRRRGERPVPHPIHFDAFVERNHLLGVPDFDQETRDDYADEVAQAQGLSFRM